VSADRPPKRRTSVGVDLENNSATVEVAFIRQERREVADLFDDDGQLRLWEDDTGWSGFLLEDGQFYSVNTLRHSKDTVEMRRVPPSEVCNGVREHIKDPKAGGSGRFVRGCSPP